ncbi:MAG: IS1595 family transposase [Chitinophagaceae bacterium]|nr:IS1595 family transposase [Chitinophagaceae bacterium]
MMNFKNLKELMMNLSDEKVCREYVEQMRWKGNPICPHCKGANPYKLKDGKTYRCKEKTCKRDFTVTVGTIMENSKIALSTWMAAIYICSAHKKGISSLQLSRDLGITQKSAWFVLHRVRQLMGEPIDKMDSIVEVDETYVGGKWENMNRGKLKEMRKYGRENKVPVMGFVQRDGKARLTVIGKDSFKDVVRKNIHNSATVITDTHLSYQGLKFEFAGHEFVNHSQSEYRNGITYTNTVEGFFSILKRTIFGTYHQVSPKHLHRYCEETAYRYNTRKVKDNERFNLTMQNVEGRLTYNNLIQKVN